MGAGGGEWSGGSDNILPLRNIIFNFTEVHCPEGHH